MAVLRLPVPYVPPIWRESRFGLELAGLRRSPVYRGSGVPSGEGRPVMLIPGFLAGDGSLGTMTHWLRQNGYHTRRAGIRSNVNCSEQACSRLEARLEGFAEHTGQKVTIVGQSRGGVFARALAVKRPDLVAGIVTLGSPTVSQLKVHPLVLAHVGLVSALGSARVPGLFSWRCLMGDCCSSFREAITGTFPGEVPYVAMYSRSDGIVDWRACLDPAADEQVEIGADAPDFPTALRAALRQAPDVIVLGEMRDPVSMQIALAAGETGHLVLSTIHTTDAASTVARMADSFPAERQASIRQEMAMALSAVLTQLLLPRKGGGRVVASELLMIGYGARAHIRKNQVQHLHQEITSTRASGSYTLEDSLAALVRGGVIERDDALARAVHPDLLANLLGRY